MEQEVEFKRINTRSVLKLMLICGTTFGLLIGAGLGLLEGNIITNISGGLVLGLLTAFLYTFFAYLYNLFAAITGGIKCKLIIAKQKEE